MLSRQLTDSVVRLSGWLLYRVCVVWQALFAIIFNYLTTIFARYYKYLILMGFFLLGFLFGVLYFTQRCLTAATYVSGCYVPNQASWRPLFFCRRCA